MKNVGIKNVWWLGLLMNYFFTGSNNSNSRIAIRSHRANCRALWPSRKHHHYIALIGSIEWIEGHALEEIYENLENFSLTQLLQNVPIQLLKAHHQRWDLHKWLKSVHLLRMFPPSHSRPLNACGCKRLGGHMRTGNVSLLGGFSIESSGCFHWKEY